MRRRVPDRQLIELDIVIDEEYLFRMLQERRRSLCRKVVGSTRVDTGSSLQHSAETRRALPVGNKDHRLKGKDHGHCSYHETFRMSVNHLWFEASR